LRLHQGFPDEREHGGVRELEQKQANRKSKKAMVFEQDGAAGPLQARRIVIGGTTRAAEVNVGSAYLGEGQEHRSPSAAVTKKISRVDRR
jgi:hypothetical protein